MIKEVTRYQPTINRDWIGDRKCRKKEVILLRDRKKKEVR